MALRCAVEVDGRCWVADVEIQHVRVAIVERVVELDSGDLHAHIESRGKAVFSPRRMLQCDE
jgi:hypothetical protein